MESIYKILENFSLPQETNKRGSGKIV